MSKVTRIVRGIVAACCTTLGLSTLAAVPTPMAQWTTLAADAKGGAEGSDGAKFTMTAGTGGSFDRGVAKTAKSSATANEGIKISWEDGAYTGRALSILIKYSGYDCTDLGNNSFIATTWGSNEEVVYANGGGSNVGLSASVSANNGGTQNMTSPAYAMPTAGYVLVSMNRDEGEDTGTRLSFAPAASYPTFTSVAYQAGHKYSAQNFSAIKIGGTISAIGKYHRPGVTIEEVRLYDRVVTPEMLNTELEDLPSVPVLLANFKTNTSADADGWYNYTQEGGASINDVPSATTAPRFKLTCSGGNIKGSFAASSEDEIQSGSYVDIKGATHTSLTEEIATSLGLSGSIPDSVLKTGMAHGARATGTATISGLITGKKYLVYVGIGVKRSGTTHASGIKVEESGYTSVDSLEYVVTQAGVNTTVANEYQAFAAGDNINAAADGIMVVRMMGVVPKADGTIVYKHNMGDGTDGQGLVSISFVAVAQMNADKFTATIGEDTDFSAIAWDGGATWKDGAAAILTATADCTIAMGDAAPAYMEIDGAGKTVTVKCTSDNLPTVRGTATVRYLIDASAGTITLSAKTLTTIQTSGFTYVFRGGEETGVRLDYDISSALSSEMMSHLVFEAGKHTLKYRRSGGNLFAHGHSNDNPTVWVRNGATLDFTSHDMSGWSGGADVSGVVRVDKGGVLNFLENTGNTFFYRQRLVLEPGSRTTFDYTCGDNGEGRFRWQGGTAKNTAQIYMMDYAEDKAGNPAVIEQLGDGQLVLASDATRGLAIHVGANAKLQLKAKVYVHLAINNAALAKYGDGELELLGGATLYDINVAEGKVTLNEDTAEHAVTVSNSCTGTGTLVITKSEVTLGQSYRGPRLDLPETTVLNLTASAEEVADGAIVLNTTMTEEAFQALTINVKNASDEALDLGEVTVVDGVATIELVTQGVNESGNVSAWNPDWSGEVVVKGTAENPVTVTVDAAFPQNVTSVKLVGNVTLAYADDIEASTVVIQPQSGATVTVTGDAVNGVVYAPVNGSALTIASGATLKLGADSALNGLITIEKDATLELTANNVISGARLFELHNHGTLELGDTYQEVQTANNNLNTFNQKFVFYSGSVTHGTRSSESLSMEGGYGYRYFIAYDETAETPVATIDCNLGLSEWGQINCDFQIAANAGLSLKKVSEAGTISVTGTTIKGLTIKDSSNKVVTLTGTHIENIDLGEEGTTKVSLANSNRCLHGTLTIRANATMTFNGGDMIPYQLTNDFVLNLYGTLDCGAYRQTLSAEGGNNVVNLFDGARIIGTGSANGGYTSILDVFQDQLFTVNGTATIEGPLGFRNATKLQVAKAEGAATAKLVLKDVLIRNAAIDILAGASVQLADSFDAAKVTTSERRSLVKSKPAAEEGETIYCLGPKYFTISIQ